MSKPVFWCRDDDVEAYNYKTISPDIDMVECFSCGARYLYDNATKKLTPHTKKKGRTVKESIYIKHYVNENGIITPTTGS